MSRNWLQTVPSFCTVLFTKAYDSPSYIGISDNSIARLLHFPRLKYLSLNARIPSSVEDDPDQISSCLTDQEFHKISNITGLQTLLISLDTPHIREESFYCLTSLTNLDYLYVNTNNEPHLSNLSWHLLFQTLTNLERLWIQTSINTDFFYGCGFLPKLTHLRILSITDFKEERELEEYSPMDCIVFCTALQCLELEDEREYDYAGDLVVIGHLTTLTCLAIDSRIANDYELFAYWTTLTNLQEVRYNWRNSRELESKIRETFHFIPSGKIMWDRI